MAVLIRCVSVKFLSRPTTLPPPFHSLLRYKCACMRAKRRLCVPGARALTRSITHIGSQYEAGKNPCWPRELEPKNHPPSSLSFVMISPALNESIRGSEAA